MANNIQENLEISRKLVIVGDSMCGKRTLTLAFENEQFISNYGIPILDIHVVPVEVDGKTINMTLYETAGQEKYDHLRSLSYYKTNIVLICFSVDDPTSLKNVIDKWIPEVRQYCGQCPIILVACKIDLRTNLEAIDELEILDRKLITTEIGEKIAAQIEADTYMECSSKTGEGIKDLLIQAARLSINKNSHHTLKCKCILQ